MRLESVAKFHSPKSPMMSDSPRATASDSLSGTDDGCYGDGAITSRIRNGCILW